MQEGKAYLARRAPQLDMRLPAGAAARIERHNDDA